jgi:predicted amidohydrolase YtcJ
LIPFIDKVAGNRFEDLYPADGYYAKNVYPFRAVKAAGGVLVAGSDAPVGSWNPMPFANMSVAVTRSRGGRPAQNPSQSIPVRDVIDAYTINGARFLGRDRESGSLEVGKSADFIVLDRDILELGDRKQGEQMAEAQVLQTWFMGKVVYEQPAQAPSSR